MSSEDTFPGQKFLGPDMPELLRKLDEVNFHLNRQNELRMQDLQLREKELDLREKEIKMKEKQLKNATKIKITRPKPASLRTGN